LFDRVQVVFVLAVVDESITNGPAGTEVRERMKW